MKYTNTKWNFCHSAVNKLIYIDVPVIDLYWYNCAATNHLAGLSKYLAVD